MNPTQMRRRPEGWSRLKWARWRYAWWLPTTPEVGTAWDDLLAWARGDCNHCPRGVGGYAFWRCALRRGHEAPHRSRNYVWDDSGVRYDPAPPGSYRAHQHRQALCTSTAARLARYREQDATMARLRAERGR